MFFLNRVYFYSNYIKKVLISSVLVFLFSYSVYSVGAQSATKGFIHTTSESIISGFAKTVGFAKTKIAAEIPPTMKTAYKKAVATYKKDLAAQKKANAAHWKAKALADDTYKKSLADQKKAAAVAK